MLDARQEILDRFYWRHGPCCAGCDHWRSINSLVGDCTRSAPVSSAERMTMLGFDMAFPAISAGHIVTPREHVCGEFRDDFDWTSLPLYYRRSVGAPLQ